MNEDAILIKKIQRGNQRAFGILIRKYQEELYLFFLCLGSSREDGEDLVQETFLRLYSRSSQYAEQGKFRAYLYTLARNLWLDQWRNKKETIPSDLEKIPHPPKNAHLSMDMEDALLNLSEKLRITLVLKIYHRFKYNEIAQILNIPSGTVKSRIASALEKLRHSLADYREEGE